MSSSRLAIFSMSYLTSITNSVPVHENTHIRPEAAIPYKILTEAEFSVHFATEHGASPRCDSKMLYGLVGALLGANREAKSAYHAMTATQSNAATTGSISQPHAWTVPAFSLADYDLVFLPGGHNKGVRQIIDSAAMHGLLADYFPQTRRSRNAPKRTLAAICHGVQVLAFTPANATTASGKSKSIIHDAKTTALPAFMEEGIFWLTRLFLGDYYKTYGYGSKSVQRFVEDGLDDPRQFVNGPSWNAGAPFIVEDETYNYVTGRFPPDTWVLAWRAVDMVKGGDGALMKGGCRWISLISAALLEGFVVSLFLAAGQGHISSCRVTMSR
jgi:putative intracellular protease/amidase